MGIKISIVMNNLNKSLAVNLGSTVFYVVCKACDLREEKNQHCYEDCHLPKYFATF